MRFAATRQGSMRACISRPLPSSSTAMRTSEAACAAHSSASPRAVSSAVNAFGAPPG